MNKIEDKIKTGKTSMFKSLNIMRTYLLLFILFVNLGIIVAQEASFQASVPSAVVKGEQFRLTYTLKNGEGSDPRFPNEIKGVDILYGPSVSQSFRTQVINGKSTSESSESYTFVLIANKEGTYNVPSATIKVNGKTLTSNSISIKVLPPDQRAQQSQGANNTSSGKTETSSGPNLRSDDAFIRAIVTKTKIYEQEAFLITFRFYTTQYVRDIGKIEFPEFEGFMIEEQDLPANRQLSLEHFNGRNYNAVDLKKSLLFPQRSGDITIPRGKIELVFTVPSGKKVQSFFGSQDIMADVKRTLTTNPVVIKVSPLPEGKPSSFANAVGSFNMTPKISATKIKANDAVTVSLTISGTGNLKLIRTPEIKLPKDFETYDPKINNDFKITENGLSGTKTIEYLFIPRHEGKYEIPPIEFSFFDPKSKSYKTLSSPKYALEVDKDPNAGKNSSVSYNQNEVNAIQDIRFIKTGKFNYSNTNEFIVGTTGYILWYIIPTLLFIGLFIFYRNQIKQNANITLMKTKKANKVATKRLKIAGRYLKEQNKEKFYEEVLRATWGYLSDKLTIPVANLSRDNIEIELSAYGVQTELTETFISILDTCEFARYAPSESNDAMDKLYSQTVNAIGEMESLIKKKK